MTWKEITLSKFSEIQSIITDKELDDLTKKVYLYALLTDTMIEQVRDIPLGIFLQKYSKELDFLSVPIPQIIPFEWEYNKVKYKITTQIEELSAGQYIDLKEYASQPDNIAKVMAVLCYDGDTYNGATHKQRAEIFSNNMPITIAAPLTAFFLELWQQWSEISLAYSVRVLKQSEAEWSSMAG